ncbi:uncharacterized protein LAESUDRAFT_730263 [Laetiporus sulphureus 93-53]|uniref:Uncharacterized protein n=1 Tax=Laetiporus sulphureus 93-53 TaxID=1314785 RepID=A0A165CBH4_9APHY|nr:uncharacterized protein LAESUDRAFT_730263 [Laetiporus sulphureus 93-53]KZT02506.1 hypothetical protein LAESUDRAFT_730263 [Laetiporus sulphureus 93-53]
MLANPPQCNDPSQCNEQHDIDPFILYAQSLHNYTLQLWTESRRIAEEKRRDRAGELAGARRREEERQKQRNPVLTTASNAV